MTSRGVERLEAPVVKDEQIDAAELTQEPGGVAALQGEIDEQPLGAL